MERVGGADAHDTRHPWLKRRTGPRRSKYQLWLTILLGGVSWLAVSAQEARATGKVSQDRKPAIAAELTGRVSTTSGGPVAGATASIENLVTHQKQAAQSNAEGVFHLPHLPPGEYRLEVTAPGYKTFLVPQLPLVAADAAHANAVLERGDAADFVTGTVASVTSRMGTALAGKSVSDLPENQRNFVNLVQVSAGANEGSTNGAASGGRPGDQHQSSAVSVGGQPEKTNNSLIDGIDNNESINSQIIVHPSVESIDAVQVLASAYPASMGRAGGGVINVLSKSGSDAFHGSLYEYFRNDLLDAKPYQFGAHNRKPELRQNQYGASLGGPVLRRRTYFFADYEGFRLIQGVAPSKLTVPTAYEHEHPGDFTDVGGPLLKQLDPAGLAYFRLYPLPNVPGSGNQYVSAPSGSNSSHTADVRIDQHLAKDDQFFSRFSYNRVLVFIPGQFPSVQQTGMTIQPGGSLSSFPGNIDDSAINSVLDYTHVFRANLTLNLRAGYTFWNEVDTDLNPGVAVNQGFGQPNINLPSTANGLAPINMLRAAPLGTGGNFRPLNQLDNIFQYGVALSWVHGSHALAAGSTVIRRQWSPVGSPSSLGYWTVNDLPSLLQGQFVQVGREVNLDHPHYRVWDDSAYIQDEWKALPKLTLDFGLRYDYFTQPAEIQDRMSNFDFLTGRIVLAGQNGVSHAAGVQSEHRDIAPRVGLYRAIGHSTALRAGYGIVYSRPLQQFVHQTQPFAYNFGVCSSQTCPNGYTALAAGLPPPGRPDPANPSGLLAGTRAFDLHTVQMQQFNLGLERQFEGCSLGVFYVAALGRHIARRFPDYNAPPPNTAANPNTLRPFYGEAPNLTSIGYLDAEGSSSYNALQASFAYASRNGPIVHVNYTFAHGLDNVSAGGFGTVPSFSSAIDYGNSSFDVRHRLVAPVFYDLPFAKNANGAKALLLHRWQVNLASVWSTGLPFTVLNVNDVSNTNPGAGAADRPDQKGDSALPHRSVSRYFNTDAFVAQDFGTLGTERGNQLYGPPSRHLNGSLFKTASLHKEATLQFRAEVFNITNTANFASPNAVLGGANYGQLTQMTAGYTPREIQFALRLQY
jgi:Carboxypeptidase regulatory-like domain/TonB dependent receptor-like, beta-barrel